MRSMNSGRVLAAASCVSLGFAAVSPCARASAKVQAAGETRATASYAAYGENIGGHGSGSTVVDGKREIVVGASTREGGNDYWYSVVYDPAMGSFRQTFVSPLYEYPASIQRIDVADVLPDNAGDEILLLLGDRRIAIHSAKSKALLRTVTVPVTSSVFFLRAADVDADGAAELVVGSNAETSVVGLDGTLRWSIAGASIWIAVGQMDADPALEIATQNGKVYDGATRAIQWAAPTSAYRAMDALDVTGDGIAELVVSNVSNTLSVFDVVRGTALYSLSELSGIYDVAVADVAGSTAPELLIGTGSGLVIVDAATGRSSARLLESRLGVGAIFVDNFDGIGPVDVVGITGSGSTVPDHFVLVNPSNGVETAVSESLAGFFAGPEIADVDGDRRSDLVTVSTKSDLYFSPGRIVVLDPITLAPRTISAPIGVGGLSEFTDVRLRDVNRDGKAEIVVPARADEGPLVEVYSVVDGQITLARRAGLTADQTHAVTVEAGDIDGDRRMDLLMGTLSSPYNGSIVLAAFDYETGAEKWRSAIPGISEISTLALVQLDADRQLEIVALPRSGDLLVVDGLTRAVEARRAGSFTTFTFVGGAAPRMFLGDAEGWVTVLGLNRQGTFDVLSRWRASTLRINGIAKSPSGEILVGVPSRVLAFTEAGVPLGRTASYGFPQSGFTGGFGSRFAFLPNRQGFVTAGQYGVHAFWGKATTPK